MGAQGGATATASVLMAYSVDAGLLLFFSAICAVSAWHYPMFRPRYRRTHRLLGLAQHACAHHGALSPTGTGAPIGSSASPSHCT